MEDSWDLFAESYINRNFGGKKTSIETKITGEEENYILNVDKDAYLESLVQEYSIPEVRIAFSKRNLDRELNRGDVTYKLFYPVSGNLPLLKCQPWDFNGWTTEAYLTEDEEEFWIEFSMSKDLPESEDIQEKVDDIQQKIRENYNAVLSEIQAFNEELPGYIEEKFDETKRRYLQDLDIEQELDIPFRERAGRPETIAVDGPKRRDKISVERPEPPETASVEAVPTLSAGNYEKILKAINDIGKGFEKSPKLFREEDEESLRDYIRVFLEMNFEGAATGETFNNQGKTDILLRHEGENVFIAECGWWHGQEDFKSKIDQLNRYLTWRDTKTAVLMFTDNVDVSNVHNQIEEGAQNHDQYIDFVGKKDESWFQYKFTFPEDDSREIDLAVMVFHLRYTDESF